MFKVNKQELENSIRELEENANSAQFLRLLSVVSGECLEKFIEAHNKGKTGWDDPKRIDEIWENFLRHFHKKKPDKEWCIHIINYLVMIYNMWDEIGAESRAFFTGEDF